MKPLQAKVPQLIQLSPPTEKHTARISEDTATIPHAHKTLTAARRCINQSQLTIQTGATMAAQWRRTRRQRGGHQLEKKWNIHYLYIKENNWIHSVSVASLSDHSHHTHTHTTLFMFHEWKKYSRSCQTSYHYPWLGYGSITHTHTHPPNCCTQQKSQVTVFTW